MNRPRSQFSLLAVFRLTLVAALAAWWWGSAFRSPPRLCQHLPDQKTLIALGFGHQRTYDLDDVGKLEDLASGEILEDVPRGYRLVPRPGYVYPLVTWKRGPFVFFTVNESLLCDGPQLVLLVDAESVVVQVPVHENEYPPGFLGRTVVIPWIMEVPALVVVAYLLGWAITGRLGWSHCSAPATTSAAQSS